MKCKYDGYFIQKYNDGLLCMEDIAEFENHLENCKICKDMITKDKIFLDFAKEKTEIKEILVENILSKIDANKYKRRHRLIPGLDMKPILKGFVPALGVVLIIAMMSFSNPFSKAVKSAVGNVLNKGERVKLASALSEIKLEEFDNKTTEITGQKLVEDLNKDGLGVAPWNVSYGSREKIFFKSHTALVGYKNGAIYKVADLKNMHADHVQGSVVSDFRFNSKGDYAVIGNRLDESEDYPLDSNIYMLETDTGKYHIIEKGNFRKVIDNWSFNGQFYVYANKNTNSNIKLFDATSKKFYEIENTASDIEKIFVSDEGEVSFYSGGNIYFLKKDTYEIGAKIIVDFEPLFINSKDNFSVALKDGILKKYHFDKKVGTSKEASDGQSIQVGDNVYLDDFRFLVFNNPDKLWVYDTKEGILNQFDSEFYDGDSWAFQLDSSGKSVFFVCKDGCAFMSERAYGGINSDFLSFSADWIDESRIATIKMILPEGVDKNDITELNAGEFEIVTYDVKTKEEQTIFKSVEKEGGKNNASEENDQNSVEYLIVGLCKDMTESWKTLKRVDMSSYLVDNLDTHLVLNWIDFDIADRVKNPRKQIISIDKLEIEQKNFYKTSPDKASYKCFAAISYTRKDPSVNGIGIDITAQLEKVDGKWMIIGLDAMGASVYRGWKERNYTTIEEMDKALEESCREQGIWVEQNSGFYANL